MKVLFRFVLASLILGGCGNSAPLARQLDEREDLGDDHGRVGVSSAGTRPADRRIDGTRWIWTEASCTEGPLDLGRRGFSQQLRVKADTDGLLLTYDTKFEAEHCTQTTILRATPPTPPATDWRMVEETRVAVPATPECEQRPDPPRPGAVRLRGQKLEVLVQRSIWCNGYEVRMVYEPIPTGPLGDEDVIRRYVANFNRRDAQAVASLFSETGSLLEPFTISDTGEPFRHDGRPAVLEWYTQAFADVPWVAMRLTSLTALEGQQGRYEAQWEYMDPRLEAPMAGKNQFTIAAGEIFDSQIELTRPPPGADAAAPGAGAAGNAHGGASGATNSAAGANAPAGGAGHPARPARPASGRRPGRRGAAPGADAPAANP